MTGRGKRLRVPDDGQLTRLVAQVVRERRIDLGMTQKELGESVGSSKTNQNNFELRCRQDMTLGLLERLSRALLTTPTEILREALSRRVAVHTATCVAVDAEAGTVTYERDEAQP